mmetsp:Transcript_17990/g.57528  ORF Transcript_17990/g.57528 Transcript_17990/m.57528 type:complete len:344 (-) Transcript_17990:2134-3165(-)
MPSPGAAPRSVAAEPRDELLQAGLGVGDGGRRAAGVGTPVDGVLQQCAPAGVANQHVGVADHDEERLRSGDGHVEAARVAQEAQVVAHVARHVLAAAADGGDDDDAPLLALELLHAAHLHVADALRLQRAADAVHLLAVGRDDAHLGGVHARVHVTQVHHVARHHRRLVAVEPRGRVALALVHALQPVEEQRHPWRGKQLHVLQRLDQHGVRAGQQRAVVEQARGQLQQGRVGAVVAHQLRHEAGVVQRGPLAPARPLVVAVEQRRRHQALQHGAAQAHLQRQPRPDDGSQLLRVACQHQTSLLGQQAAHRHQRLRLRRVPRLVHHHVREEPRGHPQRGQHAR